MNSLTNCIIVYVHIFFSLKNYRKVKIRNFDCAVIFLNDYCFQRFFSGFIIFSFYNSLLKEPDCYIIKCWAEHIQEILSKLLSSVWNYKISFPNKSLIILLLSFSNLWKAFTIPNVYFSPSDYCFSLKIGLEDQIRYKGQILIHKRMP